MYILQIEHPVPNYEGWKKAFENDPIDRKGSGVTHYRISESRMIKIMLSLILNLILYPKPKLALQSWAIYGAVLKVL